MDIHVALPDGEYLHVTLSLDARVADLKEEVARLGGFPCAPALLLELGGYEMNDGDVFLAEVGIVAGDVIMLKGSIAQVSQTRLTELGIASHEYDEAMMAACKRGKHDMSVVSLLIAAGANISCNCRRYQCDNTFCYHCMDDLPHEQMCPFHAAVISGRTNIVQVMLDAGAEIDSVCHAESPARTALALAASTGNLQTVYLLVSRGACPSVPNTESPLRHAHGPILRALLSHGCDPNVLCEDSRTPLGWAAQEGRAEDCNILIDGGAMLVPGPLPRLSAVRVAAHPVGAPVDVPVDVVSVVSSDEDDEVTVEEDLESSVSTDISSNSNGATEEEAAKGQAKNGCFTGLLAAMRVSRAKVHPVNGKGESRERRVQPVLPLAAAASTCQTRCAALLMKRGAPMLTSGSNSPLHALFRSYCNEDDVAATLEVFLANGLDANAALDPMDRNKSGPVWRVLHQALCYPRTKAVALLLKHGADSNAQVCYMTCPRVYGTAVHLLMNKACRPQEVRETAHVLKENGGDFTEKDSRNRLPHELGRGSCFLTCEDIAVLSRDSPLKAKRGESPFTMWLHRTISK